MLDHAIKECLVRPLENGLAEEGNLQYGAWLRVDPWRRNGGDTTQVGMGRAHENRQRSTASETRKQVEPPSVTGAEEGKVGDHVILLSNTKHNNSVGECSRSDTQRDLGSVLLELGKVNGTSGKVEEKEAHLGETYLEKPAPQTNTMVDMQWEKANVENVEPTFEYTFAPNTSPMPSGMEEGIARCMLGPMAMTYDQTVGWVTEKMGPNRKHWKRLVREIKPGSSTKNASPTKLKREGPTPLIDLDPNVLELKRRRGKNKQKVESENENLMAGGVAVAARQHRRAQ